MEKYKQAGINGTAVVVTPPRPGVEFKYDSDVCTITSLENDSVVFMRSVAGKISSMCTSGYYSRIRLGLITF